MSMMITQRQWWMSNVVIVASVLAVKLFPTHDSIESLLAGFVFLVVLPYLFVRMFLKQKIADFGWSFGNVTQGIIWLIVGLLIAIGGIVTAVHYSVIGSYFVVPASARLSFLMFLVYIGIAGMYIFILEFFFRGFVLNLWKNALGNYAILAQGILFIIMVIVASRQFTLLTTAIFAMSLMSGAVVARSQSILYSFIFSYISVILGIVSIIMFVK